MTTALEAAPAVASGVLLALAAGLAVLLAWASRGSGQPAWQPGELAALAAAVAFDATACPVCGGRHCAGCEAPARITAVSTGHRARRALADTPPDIQPALALMTTVERAHELVRQLGAKAWTPYRDLPTRTRVRLTAATVARRNGVPLVLGTFGARPVWP